MDVNAYVPCNCYERGVAKPAPVAIEFENGRVTSVDPDLEGDAKALYDDWCRTACSHANLCAVEEWIGTVDRVRSFISALDSLGQPVALLASVMPRGNSGAVDGAASALCVQEIAAVRTLSMRRLPHLVDTSSGEVIRSVEGVFFEAQGGDVGFDAYGLYVADRRALETRPVEERLRFRAKHVHVRPHPHGCELRDLDSDATALCLWDPPRECELEVVMRAVPDPEYVGMLDKLERLFTAAIVWSSSVYWC
ncbi:MAG: hypothetical protein JWO36_6098 [Myxococcales bacterium]|nr:hypothetical protein [Myxococcales bacterium]